MHSPADPNATAGMDARPPLRTMRIGFDIDGVLADFSSAFRQVETRLFGGASAVGDEAPEVEAQQDAAAAPRPSRRRRDAIWSAIRDTPDFWTTLEPIDPAAVRRIHELAQRCQCEVFFFTHRPATVGETIQRQAQLWLQGQGFDLPSVLVVPGPRSVAATALGLDFYVDDIPQNCLEMTTGSPRTRPILIAPDHDDVTDGSGNPTTLTVVRSIGEALITLESAIGAAPAGECC